MRIKFQPITAENIRSKPFHYCSIRHDMTNHIRTLERLYARKSSLT